MPRNDKDRDIFETTRWDAGSVRENGARSAEGSPRRRVQRKKSKYPTGKAYVAMILIISAILAGIGWLFANDVFALNKKEKSTVIEVTDTDSVGAVAKKLKQEGIINFRGLFLLYGGISHAGDKITNGTYELTTNMDYRALVAAMSANSGARMTVDVTIPEGYNVKQVIALLAKNGVNTEAELTDAAANGDFDYDFLSDKQKGDISRLEGYLFPDTYQFYCGEDATKALNRLLKNFNSKIDADMLAKVQSSPYTLDEIITIASLIEKETDGTDRSKIASVIYNRLKNKSAETAGFLQIDAALEYALDEHKTVLTNEDKEVDSPYNLYKYKGLPPTAIANPGLDSIKAALNPSSTGYYYYALGNDNLHHFFETYKSHLKFLNSLK